MKDLIKTTEGAIVIGGLISITLIGKVMVIPVGVAYAAVNIPNLLAWLKKLVAKK
jgi:hypothetical protein